MGFLTLGEPSLPRLTPARLRRHPSEAAAISLSLNRPSKRRQRSRSSSKSRPPSRIPSPTSNEPDPPTEMSLTAFERLPTELLQRIFLTDREPNLNLPWVSRTFYTTLTTSNYLQTRLLQNITSVFPSCTNNDEEEGLSAQFRNLVTSPILTDAFFLTLTAENNPSFVQLLYQNFPIRRFLFPPYNLDLLRHILSQYQSFTYYSIPPLLDKDQSLLDIALIKAVEVNNMEILNIVLENWYIVPISVECWMEIVKRDNVDMLVACVEYERTLGILSANAVEDGVWELAIERRGQILRELLKRGQVPVGLLGRLGE